MARKENSRTESKECIHQCFKWIYFLLLHTGCLGFRIRNGLELYCSKMAILYIYIVRALWVAGFVVSCLLKMNNDESYHAMFAHLTPVNKFILLLECSLCILTYLETAFILDISRGDHLRLAQRLQILDEQLQKDFPVIRWNYQKSVRNYSVSPLVILSFHGLATLTYILNLAHCRCGYLSSFLIALTYTSLTSVAGYAAFLQVGKMDMLRLRFRLIRQLVLQLYATLRAHKSKEPHLRHNLDRLIHFYTQYTALILDINKVFGILGAFSTFHDFVQLTFLGFLLCQKASESQAVWYEYLFILFFMTPRLYKVIVTSCYGFLVNKEKDICGHEILANVNFFTNSETVRDSLRSYLHWSMHNDHHLNIGKSIRCNLSLIFVVFNAIGNYIIVLIQLQFQQNDITNSLKYHKLTDGVDVTKTQLKSP